MEGGFVVVNGGEKSIYNINNNNNTDGETMEQLNLPPGFRFHPTDEEVINHYLVPKVLDSNFTATAMGEVDLNRNEPWDLPTKAKMGDKEWYFFCQRDRKYPTGMRTNRATESGYWKATGKDKEIYSKSRKGGGGHGSSSSSKQLVGMKKTLVFYRGRAPKGEKLDWVMHEFRLEGNYSYYSFPKSAKDEWVVCRVIHRTTSVVMKPSSMLDITRMNSFIEGMLGSPSLPPLVDRPFLENDEKPDASTNVINGTSTTTTTTSNVQEFSGASYPITTTMSSDGKTIYYHQLQMQPQNQNIPTSFNPNGDPISTNYSQRFDYTIPNSIRSEIKHINYQDRDQRHCNKVEHLSSNQSMISASKSQDTDLSTDHVSSSSRQEENRDNVRRFNDIENHYVTCSLSDLDSFWS